MILSETIKPALKKRLSKPQIEDLKLLRNKTISIAKFFSQGIIKLIPEWIRVAIKSVNIIRRMDYDKKDIYINIESRFETKVRVNSCTKDSFTPQWIHNFIKENEVLYDIGANIGAYSLVASKFLNENVKVYAFEPSFLNFSQLCKNIAINNCSQSIVPLQVALSDKTEINTFYYNNLTPGGALHAYGESVNQLGEPFKAVFEQPVLSFTIDELISTYNIPLPNHIKMDVDGIELSILKGAEKTLKNDEVKSIILEFNETAGEDNEIMKFLNECGFAVHSKSAPKKFSPTMSMSNCIFQKVR